MSPADGDHFWPSPALAMLVHGANHRLRVGFHKRCKQRPIETDQRNHHCGRTDQPEKPRS